MSGQEQAGQAAPEWFWTAIEEEPAAGQVEVAGADIHYLRWGAEQDSEPSAGAIGAEPQALPGLLFVHGHGAHAHWWDFIAPQCTDSHAVAALDLSGMGDSDHRDAYSADLYADEIAAVADAAALPDCTLVAHSFGGIVAIRAMRRHSSRFKALLLLDSGPRRPEEARPPEPERLARAKLYPTAEAARARFRLQPPQDCANDYLVQHIARHSIEYIEEEGGFGWKFDGEQRRRMAPYDEMLEDFKSLAQPCALIYGAKSAYFDAERLAYMQAALPRLRATALPDAQHHLFLDQPLEFLKALREQLARWG